MLLKHIRINLQTVSWIWALYFRHL